MSIARAVLATLLVALPAAAQTILHVPKDHATIQAAVDAAANGDTIVVSGGTYPEAVVVTGKQDLVIRAKGKVVIEPPAGAGLQLDGCTNCRVEKIRVAGGASFGFHLLDSTNCVLTKCRVDDTADDGIRADGGGGHLIEKCTVKFAGDDAIALGSSGGATVDDCLISKCKLITPDQDGIFVNGSGNDVESCTVTAPGDRGFSLTSAGSANTFSFCKVVKPGSIGLVVAGDGNDFLTCKVIQSHLAGVYVESGDASRIVGCTVVKSGFDGIFVDAAASNVQILDSKVLASGDENIEVDGPGATVNDNLCAKAAGHGCALDGAGGMWSRNTLNGSGGDGFFVGFGTGNTLDGNTAKGSKENGFGLGPGSSGNTLTNNVALGSKDFGLNDASGGANTIGAGNDFGTTNP